AEIFYKLPFKTDSISQLITTPHQISPSSSPSTPPYPAVESDKQPPSPAKGSDSSHISPPLHPGLYKARPQYSDSHEASSHLYPGPPDKNSTAPGTPAGIYRPSTRKAPAPANPYGKRADPFKIAISHL